MQSKQLKKQQRKRRTAPKGTVGFESVPSFFPDRMRGKMAFSNTYTFSPAAGSVSSTVFRLNSVFDPDYTGVGTSIASYGNIAAIYGRYRVFSAEVYMDWYGIGSANVTVFAVATPVTTLGTGIADIVAQKHVWTSPLSVGGPGVRKALKATTWKIYGATPKQVADEDDYCGLVGGNPNNGTFLHVGVFNPNAGATSAACTLRIIYDVEWSLPLKQTQ